MPLEKLQMILRNAGISSRRGAEQLIREGRVTVNGRVVQEPFEKADPRGDHIKVDGKLVPPVEGEKYYYLLNKPRFVVSTMSDPEGRPCLGDLMRTIRKNLFSVGRLDFDAEGLILLTNDGLIAQRLSHPSFRIPRTYLVKVKGIPERQDLALIHRGLVLGDGQRLGDVHWSVVKKQGTTTWITITVFEGKKNEIKRIFFRIGHPVRKIRRTAFGPIVLGDLPVGAWRPLTDSEKARLMQEVNGTTTGNLVRGHGADASLEDRKG